MDRRKKQKKLDTKLLVIYFIINIANIQGQVEEIAKSYFEYYKYPQEKFICQFNKEFFFNGETAFFQAYVIDSRKQKLFKETEKACLQVFNNKGEKILNKYLKFNEGVASGFIKIPQNYSSSIMYYNIVTEWGLNFPKNTLQPIFINVKDKIGNKYFKKIKIKPESGNLVDGLTSVVYTNLSGDDDKSENYIVKNKKGEEISYFKINNKGFGKFYLKPKLGEEYFLQINKNKFKLPEVQKEGVVFNVSEKKNDFYFAFRTNIKNNNNLSYIIHSEGKIAVAGNLILDSKNKTFFYLPKKKMLKGLNILTVFNGVNVIGQRVFFNDYELYLDDKAIGFVKNRINKDSVKINLYKHVKDSLLNLSVSILPLENKSVKKNDLMKKYYLDSYVNKINNLNGVFSSKKELSKVHNYFSTYKPINNWAKIINYDTITITNFFKKGFTFKGKIINKYNGTGLGNIKVNFFTNSQAGSFKTKSNGTFEIENLFIYEGDEIKLHPQIKKVYAKYIETVFEEEFDFIIPLPKINYLKNKVIEKKTYPFFIDSETELLSEVIVKANKKKKNKFINPLDQTSFVKTFEVNEKNVRDYRTVLEYLESLPGIKVLNLIEQVIIFSDRTTHQTILNNKPMNVYVNQNRLRNRELESLKTLSMYKVKSIRVNKSGIGRGGQDPFGSINIYLDNEINEKINKRESKKEDSNILSVKVKKGFLKRKKYVTPNYIYSKNNRKYNQNATLHWEPEIKLTDKGYNFIAGIPLSVKNYVVIIQGVSKEGRVIDLKLIVNNY